MTGSIPSVSTNPLIRALENGTLKTMRINPVNATPEQQAQIDETFRQAEITGARLTAEYRNNPSWAAFDEPSGSVTLPDARTLEKADAQHVLDGLQYLADNGRLDGKTLVGSFGDQVTGDLATYQQWLRAKIGVDAYA